MKACRKCGAQMPDESKYCPVCGEPVGTGSASFTETVSKLNDTADYTSQIDPADASENKIFGILAYLGLLVLVTIFAAPKNSRYSRYHANQGLVLLIVSAIYSVVTNVILIAIGAPFAIFTRGLGFGVVLAWIFGLISIVFLILAVIGIINAAKGKCKDLPVIGKIRILK